MSLYLYEDICDEKESVLISEKSFVQQLKEENKKLNVNENESENENENENENVNAK